MRNAEEQSNVPLVETRRMVETPALACEFSGRYPPFAVISIICFPFSITTLFLESFETFELSFPENTTKQAPRIPAINIPTAILFEDIELEIKDGFNHPNNDETINDIHQSEENNDESDCFEKYSYIFAFSQA